MKSIDFKNSNNILPTNTGNMPVFIGASGEVITCWKLSWKEVLKLILNRAIFVTQYPSSIAFPQAEIKFRDLTDDEKAELKAKEEAAELEAMKLKEQQEAEAKKRAVIEARNKRNPARIRRMLQVAKEQGLVKPMNGAKSE